MNTNYLKHLAILLTLNLFSLVSFAQKAKTEVIVISTIHGAHKSNPQYTYQHLFEFINTFNPDVIGIEVRSEDLPYGTNYLKELYPFEMYECVNKFNTKKIIGFDWLGEEFAGKKLKREDFQSHITTIYRNKMSTDSTMLQKLNILEVVRQEKINLAVTASLKELNDGRYDLANRIYYQQLFEIYKNTPYEELSRFYLKRDEQIAQNIVRAIKDNPNKKLLFLLGADHRAFTLEQIKAFFGDEITLNNF